MQSVFVVLAPVNKLVPWRGFCGRWEVFGVLHTLHYILCWKLKKFISVDGKTVALVNYCSWSIKNGSWIDENNCLHK